MTKCRRCGVEMTSGIAIEQTYIGGAPDFPGPDDRPITFRAGGPGRLIPCWKCPACGCSTPLDPSDRRRFMGDQ